MYFSFFFFLFLHLFSVYLLSHVDIVIRYIEVDFTFGIMFVKSKNSLYRGSLSRFYSIHFTAPLAGTLNRRSLNRGFTVHPCPIHPTRVDSSEALYDSNRFARSRSALPEVNIREITIQEPSSFLKRGNKLQSIRLRHVTIRLDSHAVDPQYRKSTSVK